MTKAAERLHTSQPAVSAHIKALESELGVTLFLRTPKGMALTPEGEELKQQAAAILDGVGQLRETADRLKGEVQGDLLLGVNTDPKLLKLAAIYAELNRRYPGLSLNVLETMSWDVAQELMSGKTDVAFSYIAPDDERIQVWHLTKLEMVIVAPISWRARLGDAGLEQLTRLPWVWTSEHCPFCSFMYQIFEQAGRTPNKAVVVDQEAAILKLVSEGVGLSIMPRLKVEEVADSYGVFGVKALQQGQDLYLIHLKRRARDQKISVLVDVIGQLWTADELECGETA